MKKRVSIFIILAVCLYGAILFVVGSSFADYYRTDPFFVIDDVQQVASPDSSQPAELQIRGTGFDQETRVVLSADVGNQRALIGGVPLWGNAIDHIAVNDKLYIANTQLGLHVLGLEDYLRPAVKRTFSIDKGDAVSIQKSGERVFMSCAREGIYVFTEGVNGDLHMLATIGLKGKTLASQANENVLFVASGQDGVQIVDISRLSEKNSLSSYPLLAEIPTTDKALDLLLEGSTLFVATSGHELLVYDIRNPAHPVFLSGIPTKGVVRSMLTRNGHLFLGDNAGYVSMLDIREPADISPITDIQLGGRVEDMEIRGERLYLADGILGLLALDISEPGILDPVGVVDIPGQARSVSLHDGLAYVSGSLMGLQIVNLEMLEDQQLSISMPAENRAIDMLLDGEWLYVAGFHQLRIIRYRPGEDLETVAVLPVEGQLSALGKRGDCLFLAMSKQGVGLVDVSEPANPRWIERLPLTGSIKNLTLHEDRLFVTDVMGGFYIVNISDPRQPWVMDKVAVEGKVRDIATDGRFIYVATVLSGVQIFELIDGQYPVWFGEIVDEWPLNHFVRIMSLELDNGLLYLASGQDGLQIFDVQNPEQVKRLSMVEISGSSFDVHLDGEQLFVTDFQEGVYLVDVSDPRRPRNLGRVVSRGHLRGVVVTENSLLLDNGLAGIQELIRPRELTDLRNDGTGRISVPVPYLDRSGWYSLHISNQRQQKSLHGVFHSPAQVH